MKVVLTEAALADLISIGEHIRIGNPQRADSFLAELRLCCAELGEMPLAFPLVQRHRTAGIRRRRYGNYLIFYRVSIEIEILHVLHGARDYDRLLFPEQ